MIIIQEIKLSSRHFNVQANYCSGTRDKPFETGTIKPETWTLVTFCTELRLSLPLIWFQIYFAQNCGSTHLTETIINCDKRLQSLSYSYRYPKPSPELKNWSESAAELFFWWTVRLLAGLQGVRYWRVSQKWIAIHSNLKIWPNLTFCEIDLKF